MTLNRPFGRHRPQASRSAGLLLGLTGHEHFTGNMLAGLGPAAAVLFVVAADDGWSAQSQEHASAVAALGIEHVLLAVTRCDLADGGPARAQSLERLSALGGLAAAAAHELGTPLATIQVVTK